VWLSGEYLLFKQNRPLDNQRVASRGFIDYTGQSGIVGARAGTFREALSVDQVKGPPAYQPGFSFDAGYRFADGSALAFKWWHLSTVRYAAVATAIPKDLNIQADQGDSFLFAPVSNYPLDFSGPPNDVQGAGAFGIWNGAEQMTLSYTQRNEIFELLYRTPNIIDTLDWRTYGFVGPRFVWFWENFQWRTFDQDLTGTSFNVDQALYNNTVSNRMYGVKIGCANEWYVGNGFSVSTELYGTGFIDIVKERASYERGDKYTGPKRKRARTDFTWVPEVGGSVNLWWYPTDGVQLKFGYTLMTFFNTKSMGQPIDFDYSAVNPGYERAFRYLQGLDVGIMFRF
jgi:hypothetical protein